MALQGRDAELRAASAAIEAARGGATRPLVIVGEAGIGKTALLDALAGRAGEAGLLVVRGVAVEHEADVPFALATAVLEDHADDLDAVLPAGAASEGAGAERFRYHRALRSLLDDVAGGKPFALVVDDLHWADEPSLEWILHLLRRPPRSPGLLLLATRPGPVAFRLVDAARTAGEHLALGPLPDDAARAVLGDVADRALTDRLLRDAGGNPLFLRELARAAAEPGRHVPETIAAAIRQEAGALDEPARRLLAGAAVAGDAFELPLAAVAADMPVAEAAPALDVIAAADLVRPDELGRVFRFRHPLVARAVYDATPPAQRLAGHERLARELERLGAPAAIRAHHVERCAPFGDEASAQLLARAAEEVAATSPSVAARWFEAALWLLPHGPERDEQRGSLLVARARALAAAGQPEEALTVFDAAAALPGTASSAIAAARIERIIGRNAAARERLLAARDTIDAREVAELEIELATAAFAGGDLPSTMEHARRAAAAGPADDPAMATVLEGLEAFVGLFTGGRTPAALAPAEERALALSGPAAGTVRWWIGAMTFEAGRFPQCAALLSRALEDSTRPDEHTLPQLRTTLAIALLYDLRPSEALLHAEAAEDGARLQGVPMQLGLALSTVALALDLLGRRGEAEAAATQSLDAMRRAEASMFTAVAAAFAQAVRLQHDPERLLAEVLPALGPDLAMLERTTGLLRYLVAAALATGRADDAAAWVDRADAFNQRFRRPAGEARVAEARAELLLAKGEAEAAVELARVAVATADGAVLRQDAARSRIAFARAAGAAGDRAGAVAALEHVVAETKRAGAEGLAAEAARELRALGARVSAGTLRASATGRDELSDRERSIAELVARGRSNKEVASTLYLSTKTVENNLSRIYAKLGVRTRTELARVFEDGE
jgi:DNA-binding NarL/FixJ family response regulator